HLGESSHDATISQRNLIVKWPQHFPFESCMIISCMAHARIARCASFGFLLARLEVVQTDAARPSGDVRHVEYRTDVYSSRCQLIARLARATLTRGGYPTAAGA